MNFMMMELLHRKIAHDSIVVLETLHVCMYTYLNIIRLGVEHGERDVWEKLIIKR